MKPKINGAILFLLLYYGYGVPAEYHVDRKGENLVKFISDAPLEDFEGITDQIDGYILWEGDDPANNSEFHFEVDLSTLDTGIGLRNRHMRENYLETDKYPLAQYSGKVTKVEKTAEGVYTVETDGLLKIHGQERPLALTSKVTDGEESFLIQSGFKVNLKDFDIKIPKLMFMKLNEVIEIKVDFVVKKFAD